MHLHAGTGQTCLNQPVAQELFSVVPMVSAQASVFELPIVTFQGAEFSAGPDGCYAPWVATRAGGTGHDTTPRSAVANRCLATPHGLRGSRTLVLPQRHPALPRHFCVHVRRSGEQLTSADGIYP